jgi:predicted nucleotide-binding protein (sugar kinase/HSP70/actin superfamily)
MGRKVAFPSLGVISLVAERYLAMLGNEVVKTPPVTRRTLNLGVEYTPESLCISCKLLFGNYIEAAEQGATDIIMLGGKGTCRLGYRVSQNVEQMTKLGLPVREHLFDLYHIPGEIPRITREFSNGNSLAEWVNIYRFLFNILDLTDAVDTLSLEVRPRERVKGATDHAYALAVEKINQIETREELLETRHSIIGILQDVEQEPERPVLRIGLVGDVYTILVPFLNHNLESLLGNMGVEVNRWFHYTGDPAVLLPIPYINNQFAQVKKEADQYLSRDVGGFALSNVIEAVFMEQKGIDGLIHVAPFNCTPELVAQGALVGLQRQRGVPVLNLIFDEQTGLAGIQTRLEAFVDMLWASRCKQRRA